MMNRRNFVRKSALGLGASAAIARWPEALRASPYGRPVGLQLYTLRDEAAKDLPGTLSRVAQTGYKELEVFDYYKKTPADWRKLLSDTGLTIPSGHYLTQQIRTDWQKHIDYAKEMGLKYMVVAFLFAPERTSLDDYKKVADLFNKAGEQTQKAGIQFCYHNHNFEFIEFGGTTGFDALLKGTDPKLVKIEMDCFWVVHAGQDPLKFMAEYPGRFPLLHIKDLKAGNPPTTSLDGRKGLFAPVGQGTIQWKPIFAAARKGGLEHYYVEQDFCEGSPFEAIKASYEYLKNLRV